MATKAIESKERECHTSTIQNCRKSLNTVCRLQLEFHDNISQEARTRYHACTTIHINSFSDDVIVSIS
jgi:hypothetical protein